MSRGPQLVKQRDITKAVKAVEKAGVKCHYDLQVHLPFEFFDHTGWLSRE